MCKSVPLPAANLSSFLQRSKVFTLTRRCSSLMRHQPSHYKWIASDFCSCLGHSVSYTDNGRLKLAGKYMVIYLFLSLHCLVWCGFIVCRFFEVPILLFARRSFHFSLKKSLLLSLQSYRIENVLTGFQFADHGWFLSRAS